MHNTRWGVAIVATAILTSTLAGCGAPPTTSEPVSGSGFLACLSVGDGGIRDKSFNETAYRGLQRAESELGVETKVVEAKDPGSYLPNITSLVRQDCGLIGTISFAMEEATTATATDNPDSHFAIIDTVPEKTLANVKPVIFNTADASYLAGYLAAGMSKTGKVGTWGGMLIPPVTLFMDGFVDGVAKYNEVKGASVEVVGWDKAAQNGSATGDFVDQNKGKQFTSRMIDQDVDIIMPVGGGAGLGALAAVADANAGGKDIAVIWVDTDGYVSVPDHKSLMLTTVLKNVDNAFFDVIAAAQKDEFTPDPYIGTLDNGGVGLAPFHDFEERVPAELKAELDQLREDIIAGKITVESPSAPTP